MIYWRRRLSTRQDHHVRTETVIDAAFIEGCVPWVAVSTIQAIIQVESDGDPLALAANRHGKAVRLRPVDLAEAVSLAKVEIAAGHTVDIGLMQLNSANLKPLGISIEQAFNPCANLRAGAEILTAAYERAKRGQGEGQAALRAALSAYNTGDLTRGFHNGYVARYYAENRLQPVYAADVYGADPIVYTRDSQEETPMTHRNGSTTPILTTDADQLLVPGVQVKLEPDEAEAEGLSHETALTERDAWESNADLADSEAPVNDVREGADDDQ